MMNKADVVIISIFSFFAARGLTDFIVMVNVLLG